MFPLPKAKEQRKMNVSKIKKRHIEMFAMMRESKWTIGFLCNSQERTEKMRSR